MEVCASWLADLVSEVQLGIQLQFTLAGILGRLVVQQRHPCSAASAQAQHMIPALMACLLAWQMDAHMGGPCRKNSCGPCLAHPLATPAPL